MAVEDIQAWADHLEVVRLPDIESDIATLQSDLGDAETLLNVKILEFRNDLDAHEISIDANQTDIVTAQGTANTAVSSIYQVDLDGRLYTDQEISDLRNELLAEITSRVSIAQGNIESKVDTDIAATLPSFNAAMNAALTDAQAARDTAVAETSAVTLAINSMLTVDLPTIQGEVNATTGVASAASNELALLKTGYTFGSLNLGFDDIIGVQIPSQIDTFEAEFRDPISGQIKATALTAYYTSAQTDGAISAVQTSLQSSIDDVLTADLSNNYYTKVEADGEITTAVSAAQSTLQTNIDGVSANLSTNYYTSAGTDAAIAADISAFEAEFRDPNSGQILATALTSYYTSAQADSAISAANNTLQAAIENPVGASLGATLANNYYTSASTDTAIANADTALKAEIEDANGSSLGATVNTQATTISTMQGNASAGYLVKAQAGSEVSLLELVAADGAATTVSIARMSASEIILDGTIFAQHMYLDHLSALSANLGSVTVTELMRMPKTTSAFMAGKTSSTDYTQQGFHIGRVDRGTIAAGSFEIDRQYQITTIGTTDYTLVGATSNTVGESFIATGIGAGTGTAKLVGHNLSMTAVNAAGEMSGVIAEDGKSISILNPKLYKGGQATGSTQDITNTGSYNLGVNESVDIEAIAGGGSGGWGLGDGSGSGSGSAGTDTIFELRIGSDTGTIIKSWTLSGGLGGTNANIPPSVGGGEQGESSPFGEGGAPGGNVNSDNDMRPGGDAPTSSFGAAGGGASADWPSTFDATGHGGGKGYSGEYTNESVDTSAAGGSDVWLKVTQIGQGAAQNVGGDANGGAGADGIVRVSAALAGMQELELETTYWRHTQSTTISTTEASINAGDVDIATGTISSDTIGLYRVEINAATETDAQRGYDWNSQTIAFVVGGVEIKSWTFTQDDRVNTRLFNYDDFITIGANDTASFRWKQNGSSRITKADLDYFDVIITGPFKEAT